MKNLIFLMFLLFPAILSAQEFTKSYEYAYTVENGVRSDIIEEKSYVTFGYQGENKIQVTFSDGSTLEMKQVTPAREKEETGENTAYFEAIIDDEPIIIVVELNTAHIRFVFTEVDYIELFNF